MNFFQIDYLAEGSASQRAAFLLLREKRVMEQLAAFDPVLAGTVPIGIDVPGSDLDILCQARSLPEFCATVQSAFGGERKFNVRELTLRNEPTVLASFETDIFPVELFAQAIPVTRQYGYRHLVIEHRLLGLRSESFRQAVIALKRKGMKTEPAFSQLLGLEGDPYEALLQFE